MSFCKKRNNRFAIITAVLDYERYTCTGMANIGWQVNIISPILS